GGVPPPRHRDAAPLCCWGLQSCKGLGLGIAPGAGLSPAALREGKARAVSPLQSVPGGIPCRSPGKPRTKPALIAESFAAEQTPPASSLGQWVLAPLLLLLAELGSGLQPTYQWRDAETNEKLTCQQCPPGTFVAQHCARDRQTVCEPCPELHYTQYWNYLEKCRYCNVICEEKQVEVQQCNATHNRVCQCQEGYYSEMEFCIRHSECPPGSGIVKPGTPFEDTQCRKCPRGFFSSSSSTEPCQPHQDCAQQGKVTNVQGNEYHDTLCTSCRVHGRSNSTQAPGECGRPSWRRFSAGGGGDARNRVGANFLASFPTQVQSRGRVPFVKVQSDL
uniref:TNF receptor superfamily member 6b n=1 Tax=Anser cygnoides TaxID=8845 RepID=A0A8B9INI9_ANSCY